MFQKIAAKTALAPPTGPVFLSLPGDILTDSEDLDLGHPTRVASGIRGDASAIQQAAAILARCQSPVIIAGDFNTWNEPRWHLLLKAMANTGLTRAPVAAPQWRHFNQTLDHVFYRGVRLIGARALTHVRSSDHIPLAADFDLTAAS